MGTYKYYKRLLTLEEIGYPIEDEKLLELRSLFRDYTDIKNTDNSIFYFSDEELLYEYDKKDCCFYIKYELWATFIIRLIELNVTDVLNLLDDIMSDKFKDIEIKSINSDIHRENIN